MAQEQQQMMQQGYGAAPQQFGSQPFAPPQQFGSQPFAPPQQFGSQPFAPPQLAPQFAAGPQFAPQMAPPMPAYAPPVQAPQFAPMAMPSMHYMAHAQAPQFAAPPTTGTPVSAPPAQGTPVAAAQPQTIPQYSAPMTSYTQPVGMGAFGGGFAMQSFAQPVTQPFTQNLQQVVGGMNAGTVTYRAPTATSYVSATGALPTTMGTYGAPTTTYTQAPVTTYTQGEATGFGTAYLGGGYMQSPAYGASTGAADGLTLSRRGAALIM